MEQSFSLTRERFASDEIKMAYMMISHAVIWLSIYVEIWEAWEGKKRACIYKSMNI